MRLRFLAGAALLAIVSASTLQAATTYTYDALGRLSVVNYDNGMQVTYTYDSAGNRTSVVTQTGSNRPPQANNDYIVVNQNGSDTFDPRTIDSDPDGDALTVTSTGTPAHGTASYTSSSVTYTPSSGYTGKDSFAYTISDGHSHTASATIYATVGGLGPIATPDSVATAMNTAITYDPRTNDVEPNPPGYTLTITSATTPSHGTVGVNSGTSLTYTPTSGYLGNDTFSYTISDGHGAVSTATDSVSIGSPPVAVADIVPAVTNTATTFDPRGNDSDAQGFNLTIASTTTPAHGTVTINNGSTLTYTSASGFSGMDTFNYTISDGHGLTGSATDTMCVSKPPVAVADSVQITRVVNSSWIPTSTFDPRSNDSDPCGTAFIVTAVTQPSKGTASINNGGSSVIYNYYQAVSRTNPSVVTTDSFTYTITDGFGGTATATVTVNLNVTYQGLQ
jgi:YD repeat-containing protein